MEPHDEAIAETTHTTRLTPLAEENFAPWVKAHTLEDTFLYWLPTGSFPMRHDSRTWLLTFLQRWSDALDRSEGLRTEQFLQYKTIAQTEITKTYQKYALKNHTMMGLGRRPGTDVPSFPETEEMKRLIQEKQSFDVENWVPDFCHWFLQKKSEEERELFAGFGGMTTIYLPPDPKTTPPRLPFTPKFRAAMPVFQRIDVDATIRAAHASGDAFLARSKQVFAVGLEEEPIYPGIIFALPLLGSGHFFSAKAEEREEWFTVFDAYINESPRDKGVLLAFQKPYEELLLDVLRVMREDGLTYPTVSEVRG